MQSAPPRLSGDDYPVEIPHSVAIPSEIGNAGEPQFSSVTEVESPKPEISQRARTVVYVVNNLFAVIALILGVGMGIAAMVPSSESKGQTAKEIAMFILGGGSAAYKSRTKSNT